MERTSVDDVARWDHPMPDTPGYRPLSDAIGATDVALNHYDLAPGEGLSGGLHTHMDQEELFYVLDGTVAFQVAGRVVDRENAPPTVEGASEAETTLGPGEAVRFAPGEVQHGYNAGDDRARVLALGAPADSEDIRSPGTCPACGETVPLDVSVFEDGSGQTLGCPACGETTEV
ncbi:MAG: cupin domain-containing protein [Haloarculaceae archaeon]